MGVTPRARVCVVSHDPDPLRLLWVSVRGAPSRSSRKWPYARAVPGTYISIYISNPTSEEHRDIQSHAPPLSPFRPHPPSLSNFATARWTSPSVA